MEVLPGIGIGSIKYGIKENGLIQILGSPEKSDEEEYIEGTNDWHRVLTYYQKNLSFTFDKEDEYRLGSITIFGPGYFLFKKDLFGLPEKIVKHTIVKATSEIPEYEDWSIDDDERHECLGYDGLGILFWFDSGFLSEMQCGYLFEPDNETIIWP